MIKHSSAGKLALLPEPAVLGNKGIIADRAALVKGFVKFFEKSLGERKPPPGKGRCHAEHDGGIVTWQRYNPSVT